MMAVLKVSMVLLLVGSMGYLVTSEDKKATFAGFAILFAVRVLGW